MGEFSDSQAIANIDDTAAYLRTILNDAPSASIDEVP
jgi:hypothetical protein